MKIKVRFFHDFREITGKKEIDIEINRTITIKDVLKILEDYFPGIKKITKYPEDYSVLLNNVYSKLTANLKDNDIVDLFIIIDGG